MTTADFARRRFNDASTLLETVVDRAVENTDDEEELGQKAG